MHESELKPFLILLSDVYALYGKTLNERAKVIFFRALSAYSLDAVRTAFDAHVKDVPRGQFAPKPADVIAQWVGEDGRPAADEAWALALAAQDEEATVVWTTETAEAFGIARSVLAAGDEVGARMAFREAYQRLVDEARRSGQPVHWQASLGWDADRRAVVLTQAVSAHRLAAPTATALLPLSVESHAVGDSAKAQACLQPLRDYLTAMPSAFERMQAKHEAQNRLQREALAAKKREMAQRVVQYTCEVS